MSNFLLRRITAFSLASLQATVYIFLGTVLLWTDLDVSAEARVSQTLPELAQAPKTPVPLATPTPVLIPAPNLEPVNPPIVPPVQLSPPTPVVPLTEFNRYRLAPGDAISIIVQNYPDLSFQATINADGNILVPLVGPLRIGKLTLEQAQNLIRDRLNKYVVEPRISVSLATQRPATVTIIGEVVRPGYYVLAPNAPILAALQVAGGSTDSADLRTLIVRRNIGDSTVEQKFDLFTPLQNGQSLPDLRLQDGDVVILQKLEIGNLANYDRQLVGRSGLGPQQINIRVLSYASERLATVPLPSGSNFVDALTAVVPGPDQANLRDVALVRFDPERGRAVTLRLDGKRALLGDLSQNVQLQNNDVIIIGRTLLAKLNYALGTITQPFSDVLQFVLFFNQLNRF